MSILGIIICIIAVLSVLVGNAAPKHDDKD